MRIGQLAARAGVTASRVRFYESKGLLPPPPRRDSGYRDYDDEALEALRLINRGRDLGYTLSDIAMYLRAPRGAGRQAMLLSCIEGRLGQIDQVLTNATGQRDVLTGLRAALGSTTPVA